MDSTVASGDLRIAVRDHGGEGEAMLLLHGGGRNLCDWELVVPLLLEGGRRVVGMDLRGHGEAWR